LSLQKCKPEWNVGNLKLESVIKLTGTVVERPPGQNNPVSEYQFINKVPNVIELYNFVVENGNW
jgi:hypothetical protein